MSNFLSRFYCFWIRALRQLPAGEYNKNGVGGSKTTLLSFSRDSSCDSLDFYPKFYLKKNTQKAGAMD